MNCVLFEKNEPMFFAPDSDGARHLREVLKVKPGDKIFAGIAGEEMFFAKVLPNSDGSFSFEREGEIPSPPLLPIVLCTPFSRPQIAKRIMFDSACFGVKSIIFYASEKGDLSYSKSSLYSGEYRKILLKGAEQACSSQLPSLYTRDSLESALSEAESLSKSPIRLAPDVYEASISLFDAVGTSKPPKSAILTIGGERGFSQSDRQILKSKGFVLASLGKRVLRTDSAAIASLSIVSNLFERNF